MPDYTYLRQENEPPSPSELATRFKKLYLSQRSELINLLIAKSKDTVEYEVSSFYRNRRHNPKIAGPTLFRRSYKFSNKLGFEGTIANWWDYQYNADTIIGSNPVYGYPHCLFPNKEEVSSVIAEANQKLSDTGITITVKYRSGYAVTDTQKYITFNIDADLGVL